MRLRKLTTNLVSLSTIQLISKLIGCRPIRPASYNELETRLKYIYPLEFFKTFFL